MPIAFNLIDADTFHVADDVCASILDRAEGSKSPGFPLNARFPTNADVRCHDEMIIPVMQARIKALARTGKSMVERGKHGFHSCFLEDQYHSRNDFEPDVVTAPALVQLGLCDPVQVKIKGEARPIGKKPRLVCLVSLVDATISRLCNYDLLQQEQTVDQSSTNTALRLDLTTPDELDRLRVFVSKYGLSIGSDVQGWEWSTKMYDHYVDLVRRLYSSGLIDYVNGQWTQTTDPQKLPYLYVMVAACFCSVHRVLVTDAGEIKAVPRGMISSGDYITFSRNSCIRSFLTLRAADLFANTNRLHPVLPPSQVLNLSAGDDNKTTLVTSVDSYRRLGFTVTDVEESKEVFSFCSTHLNPAGSYQENLRKFFANCMYSKVDISILLVSIRVGFANHPEFSSIKNLLEEELANADD